MGSQCSCTDSVERWDVVNMITRARHTRASSQAVTRKFDTEIDDELVTLPENVSARKSFMKTFTLDDKQEFNTDEICKIVRLQAMIRRYVRKIRLRLHKRRDTENP